MKKLLIFGILLIAAVITIGCIQKQTSQETTQIANPASVYCANQGYKTEIVTAADGSQSGNCVFPDGNKCEEWAYYRGECTPEQTAVATPSSVGTASAKLDISIKDFKFSSDSATINAGMSVVWTNNDDATHKIVENNGLFESGNLAQGESFAYTFASAGTYSYHCSIHPSMKGTVTVK